MFTASGSFSTKARSPPPQFFLSSSGSDHKQVSSAQLKLQDSSYNFSPSKSERSMECSIHKDEIITNFCSCIECLIPLCPECVTTHNQQHKKVQTYAEIETIRSVKQRCETKLRTAASMLEGLITNQEKVFEIPAERLDENIKALSRYRKMIEEIIEKHFKMIEQMLLQSAKQIGELNMPYNRVFSQMRSAAKEFQKMAFDLNNTQRNMIMNLQRVCEMDVQSVIGRFKSDLSKVGGGGTLNHSELLVPHLDDHQLNRFTQELAKLVSLQASSVNSSSSLQQQQSSRSFYSKTGNNNNQFLQQGFQQQLIKQPKNMQVHKQGSQSPQQAEFSASTSISSHDVFALTTRDYFETNSRRKFLHFFQNDENTMHYIDLMGGSSGEFEVITVDLRLPFRIPSFHKSIASPDGEIYLTGGTIPDGQMQKSAHIYKYDWDNRSLTSLGCMKYPRSSHGIAFLGNQIYVVGGYEEKHVMTKRCERFDLSTLKWESIASLNYAATSLSLCSFNERYLFKFGGIGEGFENYLLSPYIERYDTQRDLWEVIDPKLSEMSRMNEDISLDFGLLSTSAAVQINETEIFVFGGYHEDNSGSNQSFVLSVESVIDEPFSSQDGQKEDSLQQQSVFLIKNINTKPLPSSEAFWNNVPIIHDKKIFALQNIAGENSDNCLENERKLIVFKEKEWTTAL